MHNYAIAEVAGRQFRLQEGTQVVVPRLAAEVGETITLDKLLLLNQDGEVKVGKPYLEGGSVEAKVLDHGRSRKIWVFMKKRRKGYRRSRNERQHMTTLQIEKLNA